MSDAIVSAETCAMLHAAAEAATPGPWAYTTGCGAMVSAGFVVHDKPGSVAIGKGGFTLFEIDPDNYASGDSAPADWDEEALEERAFADSKFIALANPTAMLGLLDTIESLKSERDEAREWVRKLAAETRVLTCVYCGHSYPPGTPEHGAETLTAHIKACAKHPMRVLEVVIAAADDWRETLNLPQQNLGCAEFQEAWENYDKARAGIVDLIPERPECPECPYCECGLNENTAVEGPDGNLMHQHCLEASREE